MPACECRVYDCGPRQRGLDQKWIWLFFWFLGCKACILLHDLFTVIRYLCIAHNMACDVVCSFIVDVFYSKLVVERTKQCRQREQNVFQFKWFLHPSVIGWCDD